jgi:SAM-dependent methyltransferase
MNRILQLARALVPKPCRIRIKYAYLKRKYRGKAFYCPVCNSHTRLQKQLGFDLEVIRKQRIVGAGVRDALCPVCNASDRIRLLYLFLRKKTRLFNDPVRLLHFAPEPSLENLIRRQHNVRYLTADLYQEGVMEKIDITAIPYPNESFDAILCNHVLEHVTEDRKAMDELYRVLRPGGWAILQVPFAQNLEETFEDPDIISREDREATFGHWDHVRIYGTDYPSRLEKAGFSVELYSWVNDPDPVFHDPKLNLNREEVVFYCRKHHEAVDVSE